MMDYKVVMRYIPYYIIYIGTGFNEGNFVSLRR